MGRPSHFSSLQRRAEKVTDKELKLDAGKLGIQAGHLDLKNREFLHQKNLNLTALDRMQDVWKQQDLDWQRNRQWMKEDRFRMHSREDAAFDHQKSMWGLEEKLGEQGSLFRQWYQNRFKDIWGPIGSTFGSMTGGGRSSQVGGNSLFRDKNRSRTGRSSMGGGYGY